MLLFFQTSYPNKWFCFINNYGKYLLKHWTFLVALWRYRFIKIGFFYWGGRGGNWRVFFKPKTNFRLYWTIQTLKYGFHTNKINLVIRKFKRRKWFLIFLLTGEPCHLVTVVLKQTKIKIFFNWMQKSGKLLTLKNVILLLLFHFSLKLRKKNWKIFIFHKSLLSKRGRIRKTNFYGYWNITTSHVLLASTFEVNG